MSNTIKIILIILGLILLSVILHFNPLENLVGKVPFLGGLYDKTVLTITSKRGTLNITIDDKDYGQTPTSIEDLKPGQYTVRLERDTDSEDLYEEESFLINLYPNTESIISLEIAPEGFKSGHILYYTSNTNDLDNRGELTITSNAHNTDIYINKTNIQENTQFLEPGEYEIKAQAKGYEPIEFPVIIREGYNLNTDIYMLPIPVDFD